MSNLAKQAPVLSILQVTDLHILAQPEGTLLGVNTAHYFAAVLDLAFRNGQNYDLILLTGDLAQDPVAASYQHILAKIQAYGVPCLCLPGNHDDFTVMQQVFNSEHINCRKQALFGNWQIINLNSQIIGSEKGNLAAEELDFLESSLAAHPNHHALIAVHHHSIPTHCTWLDTMMIASSEAFWAIIKQHPQTKAVINGHIHQEQDGTIGEVRVLGTPSTCFQFKPDSKDFGLDNKSPAYRHLSLYADGSLTTEVCYLPEALIGLNHDSDGY